ncbi:MAG TPA: hypothetical protein VK694_01800 [Verrucomicrobiae bacterium]|nr:hypothetical protein [Verrucomicrobiae bacterium]
MVEEGSPHSQEMHAPGGEFSDTQAAQPESIYEHTGNGVEELIETQFADPALWEQPRGAATKPEILGIERQGEGYVVAEPHKAWVAGVYGQRLVPDPENEGKYVLTP